MPYKSKETYLKYQAAYRAAHKAESDVYQATYRATGRDKQAQKTYNKQWRSNNSEKWRVSSKRWRAQNKEYVAAKKYESYIKTKYGLTREDVERMRQEQYGVCAICPKELDYSRNTHIDHCHKTGKVRGLLCSKCNRGLGHVETDGWLDAALAYLSQ